MRCPNCGNCSWGEDKDKDYKSCTFCGYRIPTKPSSHPLDKVDVFKLAKLLKEKEQKEKGIDNSK